MSIVISKANGFVIYDVLVNLLNKYNFADFFSGNSYIELRFHLALKKNRNYVVTF